MGMQEALAKGISQNALAAASLVVVASLSLGPVAVAIPETREARLQVEGDRVVDPHADAVAQ